MVGHAQQEKDYPGVSSSLHLPRTEELTGDTQEDCYYDESPDY